MLQITTRDVTIDSWLRLVVCTVPRFKPTQRTDNFLQWKSHSRYRMIQGQPDQCGPLSEECMLPCVAPRWGLSPSVWVWSVMDGRPVSPSGGGLDWAASEEPGSKERSQDGCGVETYISSSESRTELQHDGDPIAAKRGGGAGSAAKSTAASN